MLLAGLIAVTFSPFQSNEPPPGVSVPFFPLFVALVGLVAIVFVAMGALRMPTFSGSRRRVVRAKPKAAVPAQVAAPAPPTPAPIFRKAPIAISFPMIKAALQECVGEPPPPSARQSQEI